MAITFFDKIKSFRNSLILEQQKLSKIQLVLIQEKKNKSKMLLKNKKYYFQHLRDSPVKSIVGQIDRESEFYKFFIMDYYTSRKMLNLKMNIQQQLVHFSVNKDSGEIKLSKYLPMEIENVEILVVVLDQNNNFEYIRVGFKIFKVFFYYLF